MAGFHYNGLDGIRMNPGSRSPLRPTVVDMYSRNRFYGPVRRVGTALGLGLVLALTLAACTSAPGTSGPDFVPSAPTLGAPLPTLQGGFLSEQLDAATQLASGWGPVEKDTSNGDSAAGDGERLSLSRIKYTKGLGVHADSAVEFPLVGDCSRFQVSVGIDDSVRPGGRFNAQGQSSVVFQVFLGEKKVFDSGLMTEKSATRNLDLKIPVSAKSLRLVVTDGGDGILYDHADWANARVECFTAAPPPT